MDNDTIDFDLNVIYRPTVDVVNEVAADMPGFIDAIQQLNNSFPALDSPDIAFVLSLTTDVRVLLSHLQLLHRNTEKLMGRTQTAIEMIAQRA